MPREDRREGERTERNKHNTTQHNTTQHNTLIAQAQHNTTRSQHKSFPPPLHLELLRRAASAADGEGVGHVVAERAWRAGVYDTHACVYVCVSSTWHARSSMGWKEA